MMWGWLMRLFEPKPEVRAMGQLRTVANEHGGEVLYFTSEGQSVVRIEWYEGDRICGGEGRGSTPQLAATQMLERLRAAGLI